MKKYLTKFPTYDELKQLDKEFEWYYNFPAILGTDRLRLSYNEDYNNKISLDFLEDGYLHSTYYIANFNMNKFYNLNKRNYNLILKSIKYIYDRALKDLEVYDIGYK